jgi:hypothetical protein
MSKYEKLIEYIVNEQDEKARELFHQLVVERSRQIYESLIDEEDLAEIGGDEVEDLVDEITADEDGMLEAEDDDDSVGMDDDDMDMGDAEDEEDMDMDMDMDDEEDSEDMEMGDEEDSEDMGDGDLENRIMDLEDSLDDLKREFEELMGQGDEMGGDMDAGMDTDMDTDMAAADMSGDDDEMNPMPEEMSMMEAKKAKKEEMLKVKAKNKKKMTEAEWIREYVEKIGDPYPGNNSETGEVGAGGSASLNTKSIVAGKNDMGGTTQNIARGGSESEPKGTPSNKPSGLLKKGGDLIGKVQNSPGANAGKTGYKTSAGKEYSKAHDKEGQTTAGSMSVDKKSLLGH